MNIFKVSNPENTVEFRFGCYSENEVTKFDKWTAIQIFERGIRLLGFMEKRWGISIGDVNAKIKFLSLEFILTKEKVKVSELDNTNTLYSK